LRVLQSKLYRFHMLTGRRFCRGVQTRLHPSDAGPPFPAFEHRRGPASILEPGVFLCRRLAWFTRAAPRRITKIIQKQLVGDEGLKFIGRWPEVAAARPQGRVYLTSNTCNPDLLPAPNTLFLLRSMTRPRCGSPPGLVALCSDNNTNSKPLKVIFRSICPLVSNRQQRNFGGRMAFLNSSAISTSPWARIAVKRSRSHEPPAMTPGG